MDNRSNVAKQTLLTKDSTQITVIDNYGRTVTFKKPATRIASLAPGFTEIFFKIGCGNSVILRDTWSDYPKAAQKLPFVDGFNPSVANIAGYNPDVVILYYKDDRFVKSFEKAGIPVLVFDPKNYNEVTANIEQLGVLCGKPKVATQIAMQMRKTKRDVEQMVLNKNHPLVYIEVDAADPAKPWSAGPGSFIDELLTTAGGKNIISDITTAYPQLTAEAIIRSEPQIILLLHVGAGEAERSISEIKKRPGWKRMKAIKQDAIISSINPHILTRTGPRLAEGLKQLSTAINAYLNADKLKNSKLQNIGFEKVKTK